jgi:predicted flap endonuclease-1-like 5' DNA nuclease
MDVPASVLGQLGMKIQHALRAFTAVDRKVIKQTAENYPETEFYKTQDLITQLGIGEAFVTMLNEKGVPTPLAHVMLRPPRSRMDVLSDVEIDAITGNSKLVAKYNQVVDPESAYEILNAKLEEAAEKTKEQQEEVAQSKQTTKTTKKEEGFFDNPMVKTVGRTAANIITRSLLGALGLGGRSSSRRKKSLF